MLALLVIYVVGSFGAPFIIRKLGRRGFGVLAAIPAAAAIWGACHASAAWTAPPIEHYRWVSGLDLDLWLRLDPLSWIMLMVVSVVGALVLVYCQQYFPPHAEGLRRFSACFIAFAGAMTGVVLVDHTLWLYIMWEGTSLFSFLLIGHHYQRSYARAAARQAFFVTTAGSLAMFAGFVILGTVPGGSWRISQVVDALASGAIRPGALVSTAVVLVALGAVTKSALVPTHFWLPQAMAAPTPISAFLHAAAMVKAGVYLVIRFAPGAAGQPGFTALLTVCGLGALLVGGYRALRQTDLKLILAYGTVSQLGLMIALAAQGTAPMLAVATTLLLGHATFKSALFLTTGTIEKIAGTRDLRELSGLRLSARRLAVVAGVAGLSMAGVPITLGYLGKEAGIHAMLEAGGRSLILLALVAAGSVLTVAYALRYWWGAFAIKGRYAGGLDQRRYTRVKAPPAPTWIVPAILAALTLVGGWVPGLVEHAVAPVAEAAQGHAHIAWWSGVGPAAITVGILLLGWLMYRRRVQVARIQRRLAVPSRFSARAIYERLIDGLEVVSARATSALQRGSLALQVATVLTTLVVVTGAALLAGGTHLRPRIVPAHSVIEVVVCLLICASGVITAVARRRLYAVLALGASGACIALLFVVFGAPDLALTQLVVEALTIVVFVLVLRQLPGTFPGLGTLTNARASRMWRVVLAAAVGVGVVVAGAVVPAARIHAPVSRLLPKEVEEFGYGHNIVNVILVDVRAWDTMGESSVVLVMAIGVASLIYVGRLGERTHDKRWSTRVQNRANARKRSRSAGAKPALATAALTPRRSRSVVLEMTVRVLFHTLLIVSLWLIAIGHNAPGGGFVAGGLTGIAFIIRYLAAGRAELLEAVPLNPGRILGWGLFVAALGGAWPVATGRAVFQTVPVDLDFGWAGHLHFTSALVFDIGVYLVVCGMVLDIIASVGGHIDEHIAEAEGLEGAPGGLATVVSPGDANVDFTQPLFPAQGGRS